MLSFDQSGLRTACYDQIRAFFGESLSEGKTGCMVYVDSYGNVSPLYLADLQDPTTGKIPPRVVDINAGTAQNYYNYIAHYVTPEDYEAVRALGISNPEAYDFKKILNW